MGQLDDKSALVTGASSGIGLAIARRFAAEGATVYLTGRREAELDAAVARVGARGVAVQSDASDHGDLDRLFAEIANRSGRLDIVVANAGVGEYGPLGTITEQEYDRTTSINLKGTVFIVQKALPLLTTGASVMLVSSSAALRAAPGLGVYAATKAAIRGLARTWAAELADRGIRVNTLTPGDVETPGGDELRAAFPHGDQPTAAEPATFSPLGRIGRPEEVAATALYLAGDQSSFTTGAELLVDGGATQL
ncbi:NAD(P)-dependent dehydrogenase, short-chain alcohol dehydrogenase family [Actinopolyspora lacussalsi subsp. righensis]|uniref:NAD(P)-dependent dehydrogenase, short-chain alcohol dehydrogenase family n=1 Tax=Actinopolyspora righensis TaxID=995060 RepID=A0A1I6ZBM8_9ACTN|nr:glucose 1-dehydrogenase [Actinopolyspora righensis]SFT60077.1 NAD(P)-dependent dehydrogenase, short-chain alcohol dehydrogenase family [Actinopolyspora righensis]